jgi:tRNA G10  N-methylase Trm11
MYIVIKGGRPTDWYSDHKGIKYKVVHEGHDGYLVESQAMGEAWRIVAKDDCEKTSDELFCQQVKQHDVHYDNKNGSLYKFAEDHELNAWEFDIIKRITRCRKKGQFKDDLEKTKRVIDLYLKEFIST